MKVTLIAQLVKNLPAMQETGSIPGLGRSSEVGIPTPVFLGFPCGSAVKNPAAMRKTWIRSLGWEDPLEKGKATHSIILAWSIP